MIRYTHPMSDFFLLGFRQFPWHGLNGAVGGTCPPWPPWLRYCPSHAGCSSWHPTNSVKAQTCRVSRISRETHAFSMSLTLSLRTVEISCIFLLNEKQYFNVRRVLLLWWEMRVLTPALLLLTLGLLIFMCGSIRHTAQWQCPGSKLVHMTVQVSTRSWQHIDTIYGLRHCVHLVYAGLATLISYTYVRLIDSV